MSTPYKKKLAEKSPFGQNCVMYARSKVPSLPYGLFTFEQKKRIETNSKPKEGDVAIIRTNQKWGHVAVVTYVGKRHITIKESNWWSGYVSERHDTPQALRVHGYFRPKRT